MTEQHQKDIENSLKVVSRYPDAYCRIYAKLSLCIWSPLLKCRLSGFFHTSSEAWESAVEWIDKKESETESKKPQDQTTQIKLL